MINNTDQAPADVQSASDLYHKIIEDCIAHKALWASTTAINIIAKRDTAIRAKDKATIEKLRDALNVAFGHMTGGMDGDWRNCDPVELIRKTLTETADQ